MPPQPIDGNSGGNPQPLEADPTLTVDDDSAYGDELESFTTSLKPSITDYQYENGRRYHAFRSGSYPLPNDTEESNRLAIFDHMINLSLNGDLHLAPIGEHPQRILDIGTGTGLWAVAMGYEYPSADILGVDLSPIQPTTVPPNVRFEVDDVEYNWTFSAPFDYIHSRYMVAAIEDWPKLVKQTFEYTRPGGWAEFQDLDINMYSDDDTFAEDLDLKKWNVQLIEGYSKLAREPCPGPKLEGWLKDAGFENVTHRQYKLPVGPWPRDKHHV
ncbi:MAG: hypothetical protein M1839_001390 [Geoglossum umbratile]|nr:MAG: hypothetical protein M1839_001390 [Geoglossum umbratile]